MAHPRAPSTPLWLLSLGSPNGLGQAYLFASELAAPVALDRSTPASGVIRGHTGGDLYQCAPRWTNSHCLGSFKNGQPVLLCTTKQASHSRTSILRINPVGYRR